ncbi:MAG: glutamine--fructose-6-phosphate transaminase (isomerizing) [Bryobacterales bacterium]|nr:glutamine--fructose-6-phosphate transaminase (isomerizing) [Bryobacterales bacterium]
MAGIVGYTGRKQAASVILDGLRRLEYSGYDSAGLAVGSAKGVRSRHTTGTLRNLETAVRLDPVRGTFGVGHTSWIARHLARPSPTAAAKLSKRGILVAVSGDPGNLDALWERLPDGGARREATSTPEALALLIHSNRKKGDSLEEAVRRSIVDIEGICAIAVIANDDPGKVVAARLGQPTLIGLGKHENFIASDKPAILHRTRDMIQLEDGDIAVVTARGVQMMDSDGRRLSRSVHHVLWDPLMAEKSGYKHFVLKEIFEQPRAIRDTALGRLDEETGNVVLDELGVTLRELRAVRQLNVIGSGSSWHAGLIAKNMVEHLARVHVKVEFGSEFRYSDPVIDDRLLSLVVSKSGETADTLAAQQLAHQLGSKTIAICNSIDSTMAHNARGAIHTHAGPELAAVSTKAFSAQLTALYLFAMYLGQARDTLSGEASRQCARDLLELPSKVESALELAPDCERVARQLAHTDKVLYLGRGIHYPIALEAARMLKELSRIQADACAAGEMRHGPTALVDSDMVVVVLATVDESSPSSRLRYEKTLSQVREVTARHGRAICIANEDDARIAQYAHEVIRVPVMREPLQSAVSHTPLQLLAYYTAVLRGCDVDQPRDLGRSITAD